MNRSFKRKSWLPLIIIVLISTSAIASLLLSMQNGTEPNGHTNGDNNGVNNNQTDIKIVGKNIPPGYVMGNILDIKLLSGIGSLIISNSKQRASIRFTAQLSGEVSTLTISKLSSSGRSLIRVGLQEDSAGAPKGLWMNEEGFAIIETPSEASFITASLQRTVTLSKDTVYHIVIEVVELAEGDQILLRTYLANAQAHPLNIEDPDIVWPDPMMNTLFYNGKEWREEDKWPIFVVGYSDGRYEGQPYTLEAPWVIYLSKYVGQTIIPASDYSVGKIAFVVSVKGEPLDSLYYQIRDQNNDVMVEGLFATADQLTNRMKWVEVTLPSPVKLTAGKLYRIILLSPKTKLENPYRLYGHEFVYKNNIGYGGLQHQLTTSVNSGEGWIENKDADAVFKVTSTE